MTAPSKGPDDGKLPNPHTKWPPESSTISGQTYRGADSSRSPSSEPNKFDHINCQESNLGFAFCWPFVVRLPLPSLSPSCGYLNSSVSSATGPLKHRQKVLINGAGGGVGTLAIQIAKVHDVEVTGVDLAEKLDLMRSIGYDHVIDYQKEDFTKRRERYDLILDTKTNRSPFDYARALNPGGRYATVGGTSRALQVVLLGPWIGGLSKKNFFVVKLKPNQGLPYLCELFEAGKLVPVIDGPYRFTEVREAFRRY